MSGTIIAVVPEEGSSAVRRHAIQLARSRGAQLILWDANAGERLLEDPLPTAWSADGEQEQFGDRLTVNDLEAAGRAPLARQVREAQHAGIEAWGWLPSGQGAEELVEYARRQGADTIVVGPDDGLGELREEGLRVEVAPPG